MAPSPAFLLARDAMASALGHENPREDEDRSRDRERRERFGEEDRGFGEREEGNKVDEVVRLRRAD